MRSFGIGKMTKKIGSDIPTERFVGIFIAYNIDFIIGT
jgi:hypothetical protein